MFNFDPWRFAGGWFCVVRQRHGEQLSIRIVDKSFSQSHRNPMCYRSVDLPVHHIRVDEGAIVAHDDVTEDLDPKTVSVSTSTTAAWAPAEKVN